jgi:FtsH-binding integral membrane protein
MTKYRRRLFIVLSAAVLWSLLLGWFAFHPHFLNALGQQRTMWVMISCLCGVVPILVYPRVAKRAPAMKMTLTLFGGYVVLISVTGIASFAFDVHNKWTVGMEILAQALVFAALVISIRQAIKNRREKTVDRIS